MSDEVMERGVLAGALCLPETAEDIWGSGITPDHFAGRLVLPAAALYRMWQESTPIGAHALVAELMKTGDIRRFGAEDVFDLVQHGGMMNRDELRVLISRLEEMRQRRKATELATRVIQYAESESSDFHMGVSDIAAELAVAVQTRISDPMATAVSVNTLIHADYPARDWVIPGLLYTRARAVITGPEGLGKSELLYQIALGAAMGRHPFTERPIPTQKVLVIDGENEPADLSGRLKRITNAYAHTGAVSEPRMMIQPALGWNLLDPRDSGALFAMVRTFLPDLLIIGPVYQIMDGDQNDAEVVRRFMRVVDECRRISDCAVMTEAHANNDYQGVRQWRPSGSSLWRRWPEFGIGLNPVKDDGTTMELKRWRGDRVTTGWPDAICRGPILPWIETMA